MEEPEPAPTTTPEPDLPTRCPWERELESPKPVGFGLDDAPPERPLGPGDESLGLTHELFLPSPKHAAPHPVIVFLHSRQESGSFELTNQQSLPGLLRNQTFAPSFPFIVIVPQCPKSCA